MKCVRVATSGLVGEFDFASSSLASSRKSPEVSAHPSVSMSLRNKEHNRWVHLLPSIIAKYSSSVGQ